MPFTTKQKIFLTTIFLISLLPMFTTQYGVAGVNGQSGLINLVPFGIIGIILYLIGLWAPKKGPFKNAKLSKILGLLGAILIVVGEIVTFIYADHPNSSVSLGHSFEYANSMFFLGFFTSLMMVFIYGCVLTMTKPKTPKRK